MTARHEATVRPRRFLLAGILMVALAAVVLFLHVGSAHADSTTPDPTQTCDLVVDPTCLLPTLTPTDTTSDPGSTGSSIPTDPSTSDPSTGDPTSRDPSTGDPSTTVTTTDAPPVTDDPSTTASSSTPPVGTTSSTASSSSAPVGTLGNSAPNQDGPIQTSQNCGGLLCASNGYDPASASASNSTVPQTRALANTGSSDGLLVQVSVMLLIAGGALMLIGSGKVPPLLGRRIRRH